MLATGCGLQYHCLMATPRTVQNESWGEAIGHSLFWSAAGHYTNALSVDEINAVKTIRNRRVECEATFSGGHVTVSDLTLLGKKRDISIDFSNNNDQALLWLDMNQVIRGEQGTAPQAAHFEATPTGVIASEIYPAVVLATLVQVHYVLQHGE